MAKSFPNKPPVTHCFICGKKIRRFSISQSDLGYFSQSNISYFTSQFTGQNMILGWECKTCSNPDYGDGDIPSSR